MSEHADLALVRKASAGDEVDHHLGGAPIESAHGDALARRDGELPHPERTQAVVVLLDSGELENGRHREGFASLTIFPDEARASSRAKSSSGSVTVPNADAASPARVTSTTP